jgi:hypothetical protein
MLNRDAAAIGLTLLRGPAGYLGRICTSARQGRFDGPSPTYELI